MGHQKLTILIVVSAIASSTISAVDRLTADDSTTSSATTVPRSTEQEQARDQLDQPPSRPVYPKPLAQGPNKLLVFRNGRLVLLDPDGKNERALTVGREAIHGEARLSPDGTQVLYGRITPPEDGNSPSKRELMILDISTGKSTAVADIPVDGEILSHCWSPDGKRIAYIWRQFQRDEGDTNMEAESRLVICDPDGKTPKTIASEKGSSPQRITLGWVDWQ